MKTLIWRESSKMRKIVVVNTSCLIALGKIRKLDLLCKLFNEVLVPIEVREEFTGTPLSCMSVMETVKNNKQLFIDELNLGRGEAAAIALALETKNICIIDDLRARKVAIKMGIKVIGTIGILLIAEKKGFIQSAYDEVKSLQRKGFFISNVLLEKIKNQEYP